MYFRGIFEKRVCASASIWTLIFKVWGWKIQLLRVTLIHRPTMSQNRGKKTTIGVLRKLYWLMEIFQKVPLKKKLKIEFKLLLTSSSYGFFYFNSLNCLHCLHFVLQLFIVLKFFKYSWKPLFQVECTFIFIEFTSTDIVHSWLEVITLSNYARCGMNIDDATNVSCIEVSCVEMGIGC